MFRVYVIMVTYERFDLELHIAYPFLIEISSDFTLYHMCLSSYCHVILEFSFLPTSLCRLLSSCHVFSLYCWSPLSLLSCRAHMVLPWYLCPRVV